MNIFESAARNRFRFESAVGNLTVEDLFVLPLTSTKGNKANLDDIAKLINSEIQASSENSFVSTATNSDKLKLLNEKLEIVKFVIADTQDKNSEARQAVEKAALKEKLKDILADKQNESYKEMSVEDIQAKIAELT